MEIKITTFEQLIDVLERIADTFIAKGAAIEVDLTDYLKKTDAASTYVAKDGSKVLSTNDFTTAEKNKLANIAENANNYTYTLPNATSSTLGGVKIGSNISVSNGTISLSSANVTAALGYTPPSADTTYSVGTASALGLTKLYTGTGTNTDGTMTQAAINSALSNVSVDLSGYLTKTEASSTYALKNQPVTLGTAAQTTEGAMWVVWS